MSNVQCELFKVSNTSHPTPKIKLKYESFGQQNANKKCCKQCANANPENKQSIGTFVSFVGALNVAAI